MAALLLAVSTLSARAEPADQVAAVDSNVLVGVGLVIGLPGTGDSTIDQDVVDASIVGVLKRAGLEPWRGQIRPGYVAVVMVSAELPRGSGDGTKIDVSISAIGDARSIAGGTLLVAPLRDPDGIVHATGQGLIAREASTAVTIQVGAAGLREAQIAEGAVIGRPKPRQDDVAMAD
ncbi:MAG: flagellar basal body P-ring protein FlgI [Dongiaceae bacterium]